MPVDLQALVADLAAETADLWAIVADLPAGRWADPTPAPGWTIFDQLGHLAYFDETATLAATDPERFRAEADVLVSRGDDYPDQIVVQCRSLAPFEMLEWFRRTRAGFLDEFTRIEPAKKLPWYGPDMAPASSVTARLMETWAHGQDIADAVGVTRVPTARLRHIAHLGVRTTGFSYLLRGLGAPTQPVYIELSAPDGSAWMWGPADAADRVSGPALDFCLVVTQRKHRDDTDLTIIGPVAQQWLSIAQAFAGAPGPGRPKAAT